MSPCLAEKKGFELAYSSMNASLFGLAKHIELEDTLEIDDERVLLFEGRRIKLPDGLGLKDDDFPGDFGPRSTYISPYWKPEKGLPFRKDTEMDPTVLYDLLIRQGDGHRIVS